MFRFPHHMKNKINGVQNSFCRVMKYTVVAWDSTLRTNMGPRKLCALCLANGRKGSVTKPYTTRIE